MFKIAVDEQLPGIFGKCFQANVVTSIVNQ